MGEYEDRADIIAITHDYCWALDRKQWHELDDVFVADAAATLGSLDCLDREEIKAICSTALGRFDESQHIVATHQVRFNGDTATCRCYLHAQHIRRSDDGETHHIVGGRYEDEFVRTADGWRIQHRTLTVMWST